MSKSKSKQRTLKRRRRKQAVSSKSPTRAATEAQRLLGHALECQRAGDLDRAKEVYFQVLRSEPENADAWHLLGMAFFSTGHSSEAQECLQNAESLVPNHPEVLANLGLVCRSQGQLDDARSLLEQSLKAGPSSADVTNNLGTVCLELGDLDSAEVHFREALEANPGLHLAAMNLGNLMQRRGRARDAVELYRGVLKDRSADAMLLANMGEALRSLGHRQEAVQALSEAIRLDPNGLEARLNLGRTLSDLRQFEAALEQFQTCTRLFPNESRAFHYLGRLHFDQGDMRAAETLIRKAVLLNPKDAFARASLGFTLLEIGQRDLAEACFCQVILDDPSMSDAHSCLLFLKSSNPELDMQSIFQEHRQWAQVHTNVDELQAVPESRRLKIDLKQDTSGRRLRVGYVSPDFRRHAVASFIEPVLEAHDREKFEIVCYAEVAVADDTTRSLEEKSDVWRYTHGLSHRQVAETIREDEIDILVDLAGHTARNRLISFAYRPAPVQVTWMGYPNTTGMESIDYRLTCATQDPLNETSFHTEQLLRLPHGSFCFQPPQSAPDVNALPLAQTGVVTFGSLHRPLKITETTRDLWAAVLQAVPDSRLLRLTLALRVVRPKSSGKDWHVEESNERESRFGIESVINRI